MNFKFLFLIIILAACGVKGDPVSPKGKSIPSVLENYEDIQVDQPLKDAKKK